MTNILLFLLVVVILIWAVLFLIALAIYIEKLTNYLFDKANASNHNPR